MMNTRHCHDEHNTLPNRNKKTILYCEEESRTTCLHCFNLGYSFLKISCSELFDDVENRALS